MTEKYREAAGSNPPADLRPIVDEELEKNVDRAAIVHARKKFAENKFLPVPNYFGKGPKGYQRSDTRIYEDACEALYKSYDVDASSIEVKVNNGCVYLSGEVDNREMKKLAEDAVENISGVVDVENRLSFKRKEPVIKRTISDLEDEYGTRLS